MTIALTPKISYIKSALGVIQVIESNSYETKRVNKNGFCSFQYNKKNWIVDTFDTHSTMPSWESRSSNVPYMWQPKKKKLSNYSCLDGYTMILNALMVSSESVVSKVFRTIRS